MKKLITPIGEVFEKSLLFGDMRDEHRQNQREEGYRFIAFVGERFKVEDFYALTDDHVEAYAEHLLSRSLKTNTIRAKLNPVRLMNRYAARRLKKADRFEVQAFIPKRKPLPKRFLSFDQLCVAIREARRTESIVAELGLICTGFAGMRLQEIARLTEADFDGRTVWIHDSKNEYSSRLLPVCGIVANTLRSAFIAKPDHRTSLFQDYDYLGRAMRRCLRRCHKKTGDDSYLQVDPRDGRKAFDNLLVELGVPFYVKEGYMGHKLNSMAEHYTAVRCTPSDMRTVREHVTALLNSEIVEPLEKKLRSSAFSV